MTFWSSDDKKFTDIGTTWWWTTLTLTINKRLKDILTQIPNVTNFLKESECKHGRCKETAEELKLVKEKLALLPISEIVLEKDKKIKKKEILKDIDISNTSCDDFLLTSDGRNILLELINILEYSAENNCDVVCTI